MPRTKNASAAIATVARQIEKLKNANMQADNDDVSDKSSNQKKIDKKSKVDKKSKDIDEKDKRPKTAYQKFFTEKLAEIRKYHENNGTQCPVYKDIRTQIIDLWNQTHKPSKTEERRRNTDTGNKTNKKEKDTETTRKPSEYNLFVKEMMPLLKKEHENDEQKLAQKDYMKLIGEKWREHKAMKNIN